MMNHEWTDQEKQAILNEVIRLRNPDKASAKPHLCNLFAKCESCPYHTVLGLKYCLHDVSVKDEKAILAGRSRALVLACGLELPEEQEQSDRRTMTSEELAKMIASRFVMSPQALQKCDEIALALVGVTIIK